MPPAEISAGQFFDLAKVRSSGLMANLRTIDKAANNSSLVLEREWNGCRLLFPCDTEASPRLAHGMLDGTELAGRMSC